MKALKLKKKETKKKNPYKKEKKHGA